MRNLFVVAFAASLASACAPPSTTTGGPTGRFTCSVDSDCGFDQVCGASDSCRDLQPGECRQDNPNICGCEFDMECPGDMTCGAAGLCEGSGGGGGGGGQNDAGPVNPPSENCESAADCPMDMYCNPTSLECAELPAGTCRENAQCESNNCVIREGRELGRCEGGLGECTENTDCPDGEMCDNGTCVGGGGGGCTSLLDCGFGEICEEGRCVEDTRCFGDFDCGDRQVCRESACVDVACTTDAHCGEGSYCDENNACIQGSRPDDHGNDYASATRIDDNATTSGNIEYVGDLDVFAFRATLDGSYSIESSGATDVTCALATADGNELATNDDGGQGGNCLITHALTANTEYQVIVAGFGGTRTGAFGLALTRPENGGGNNGNNGGGNDDHGNDIAGATGIQAAGDTAGEIEAGGDEDFFRFTPAQSASWEITTVSNIDTYCYLLDTNGDQLALNDDGGEGTNCMIRHALTAGTTYYIRVRHFSRAGTGAYTLRLSQGAADQGNTVGTAQAVQIPARIEGRIEAGDHDWFAFTAGAAGTYTMTTESNIDTRCELLDAQGNGISEDDDGGAGLNCQIEAQLNAGTSYIFAVRGFSNFTLGDYTAVITGP